MSGQMAEPETLPVSYYIPEQYCLPWLPRKSLEPSDHTISLLSDQNGEKTEDVCWLAVTKNKAKTALSEFMSHTSTLVILLQDCYYHR
jgi:hypothetical protein